NYRPGKLGENPLLGTLFVFTNRRRTALKLQIYDGQGFYLILNKVAERILRIAVQWRKTSFGNRSDDGEVATARLLTVTQTCRMQRRHVLGYLTEAVRCYRSGQRVPSLLAQQTTA